VIVSASATAYFGSTVDITVLDHEPPVVTSPAATTPNARDTIRWGALPGAVRYDLQLANLSLKIPSFIFAAGLTTTSFTPPENLGIGKWRVWVRAYDQFEVPGFWSFPRDFQVVAAPTVTAPVTSGTFALAAFPDISWTAVADAVRYELWVNNVTNGSTRVIYKTDLRSTTYRETATMSSGVYSVFVRAVNAVNEAGNWSQLRSFTVLAPPTVTRPEFNSTFDTTPFFEWTAVVGARFYDIWVSNRANGVVVIRDQAVPRTSFQAVKDLARGDYSVWVRAVGDKLVSVWSPVKNFSIGAPPTLLNPIANAVVAANHKFSWTAVGDAEKYEIWLQRDSDNAVFNRADITGTSFQFGAPLVAGGYRIWLRAISIIGERSGWSPMVRFRVAASETTVPSNPADDILLTVLDTSLIKPEVPVVFSRQQKRAALPVTPEGSDVVVVHDVSAAAAVVSQQMIREVDAVMESWNNTDWWLESPAVNPLSVSAAFAAAEANAITEG
jgi:hypothetical protein